MQVQLRKNFLLYAAILAAFAGLVWARGHHALNGTWNLLPARSEFAGEPVIQTGTVTIYDREHNIYVSRDFSFDSPSQSATYRYSTDARENQSIRRGQTFQSKARWDGDALRITTTQDGVTSTERYSLSPDGTLTLAVERPGQPTETLLFERR